MQSLRLLSQIVNVLVLIGLKQRLTNLPFTSFTPKNIFYLHKGISPLLYFCVMSDEAPPEYLLLEKCILRKWRSTDRYSLQQHANNHKISVNLRDKFPWPYTLQDADTFLAVSSESLLSEFAAITINDVAVGGIGIEPFSDVRRFSCEIGYWLSDKYWNKGILSEVLAVYSEFIFNNTPFIRLEAHVFDWNTASSKVLERCGFAFEGRLKKACFKDNKWCDMLIYGKIKPGFIP